MIRRFITNYLPRHRNRTNQILHLIGVPLTFIRTPVAIGLTHGWLWPLACFVTGYALQFVGHAVEGNDAGEAVFVKKLLGKPYTEYAQESQRSSSVDQRDDMTRQ